MADDRHPRLDEGDAAGAPTDPRRRLFAALMGGVSGLVALVLAVPFVGFLVGPALREAPARWRRVGRVDAFPRGTVHKVVVRDPAPLPWAGFAAESAAWLRREADGEFVAFSSYCTHVGCPINWVAGARLFLCPCHGGAFHADGRVAAGPPPRSLATHRVRVRAGQVEVETRPLPLTRA